MDDSDLFAQATVDGLSAHIAIVDESGKIVAVNRAWREFACTNDARDEVSAGANYLSVCDAATGEGAEYASAFAEGVRAALAGRREEFALEYPCHSPSERRWYVGRVTRFPGGGPPRAVIAHENVTQRKLAEEAMERTLEARTRFLAEVSHELRTPLTVILGNVEVGRELDAEARDAVLEEIAVEAARMSRMVEDLLLLARSDSEALPLDLETVPARELLGALARRAEALARELGVPLHTDVAGEGALVCDAGLVEQAVLVLVDNAARYGASAAGITLISQELPGELIVEVADSGPGIPPEELPRIFDRFFRGETAAEKRGSGLGLAIARTIAEAHGGRLEATSRVGAGTKMSLYLPTRGAP